MTVYAYYRVSTDEQDYHNQRKGVLEYAKENNLPIEAEVIDKGKSGTLAPEKRQLGQLLGAVKSGDVIITSEISRVSRKLTELFKIIDFLNNKGVCLRTVKDRYILDNSIQGQVLLFAFGLVAQIERDLISQRTKEALALKKQQGVKIGRSKGIKYRRLERYEDYIRQAIEAREPKVQIAKKCNCDWNTLHRFLKEKGIKTYGNHVKIRRKNKEFYDVDYSKSYVTEVNKGLIMKSRKAPTLICKINDVICKVPI